MIGMEVRPYAAFLFCALLWTPFAAAQTLNEAASELAAKILQAIKPREAATFSLENKSSLGAAGAATIRAKLEASHLKLAQPPTGADVRVTLSENFQGYVWVAEIANGAEKQVAVIALPRPETPNQEPRAPLLTLAAERIWEQESPILDWTFVEKASGLLILETERLVLFRRDGQTWTQTIATPVPAVRTRDPRGHIALVAGTGGFTVYLPSGVCTGLADASLTLDCHAAPEPWPLEAGGRQLADAEYAGDRNYFGGRVTIGTSEQILPPFYSFAALQQPSNPVWLFAGIDGVTRAYTPKLESVDSVPDWGSGVTSVITGCGNGWQALATGRGDETEPDSVRAYRFDGHGVLALSAPLDLSGAVTALWPAPDGKTAHAVIHDMKTNRYAALRLDITCGQ